MNTKLILSNSWYNFSKKLVQIILPATSSLYFGLAQIWGLPSPEKVMGTLALIAAFLGVVLGISTSQYNKSDDAFEGNMVISPTKDGKLFSLELNSDPNKFIDMPSVRFKVTQEKQGI